MKEIKIYDYKNDIFKIAVPDKKIVAIFVVVLSGDETVCILFEDGTYKEEDACAKIRVMNYFDYKYIVTEEAVDEWINWDTPLPGTKAYMRAEQFMRD